MFWKIHNLPRDVSCLLIFLIKIFAQNLYLNYIFHKEKSSNLAVLSDVF